VLVSGLNLHHSGADRLMRSFRFVPLARVDDLMVSYAAPGGGVGPHTDSYDVFLVQGAGRRRWRVWFDGEVHSYDTGPGDLLYLPPGLKHDGVALEPCFTYSVGFRAPAGSELGAAFLDFLHERGLPEARYRDPALRPARHPALLPGTLVHFAAEVLGRIRWSRADVLRFMGEYLTTPKPHVVFSPRTSRRLLRQSMVRLDAKTQLLYSGSRFFINGETVKVDARASAALRALADRRALAGRRLADAGLATLAGAWRAAGWAHFERD
jgi:50S ribosomal protein L16 3-hydroxylase